MSEFELELRQNEAKLVFLAVAYHLGRPGAELDPITKQAAEHGLAEVARDLQPQLRMALARISLNPSQVIRLQSGMLGSITELKTYPMFEPRPTDDGGIRRSTVPGFDNSLIHLFPEVEDDPEVAIDIAEQLLLFKRRFDQEVSSRPPEPPEQDSKPRRRKWWPFRR